MAEPPAQACGAPVLHVAELSESGQEILPFPAWCLMTGQEAKTSQANLSAGWTFGW